jgi:hypothetical protein
MNRFKVTYITNSTTNLANHEISFVYVLARVADEAVQYAKFLPDFAEIISVKLDFSSMN